ncbi:hypothetical protein YC2023_041213 [Brassica napus]
MASCLIPLIHAHDEALNVLSRSKSLCVFGINIEVNQNIRTLHSRKMEPYA